MKRGCWISIVMVFPVLLQPGVQSDSTFTDIVTVSHPDSSTTVWRISSPNVRQATTAYPQIQFHPGDAITITAGGCVGTGKTWKSYVQPLGNNAGRFYSGTIMIPAVIPSGAQGYQRIGGWISTPNNPKTLIVPEHLPSTVHESELFLHLGYQDDDYSDNGYSNHDNGDPPQCANTGPAWVEVKIVSGKYLAKATVHRLEFGPQYSPHFKPFDLVWDLNNGVDANGLPLNPLWAYQIDHPGQEADFKGICHSAFSGGDTINVSVLASICTSQAPSTDLSHSPTNGIFGHCGPDPLYGHLNWTLATYTGAIYWAGYEGGWPKDDDFNLNLFRSDKAGLTTLNNDGLGLEFNEDETLTNFKSPFWVNLENARDNDTAAARLVRGPLAVVTGLIGIDGVHGGYTESHPVFSLAIRTSIRAGSGGVQESWAFFLRNMGDEGGCSELQHFWYGLADSNSPNAWYFIQLPWPEGATDASIIVSASQVRANDPRIKGPKITKDSGWTYLGFQLPAPEASASLDGEITLHYTIPPGSRIATQQLRPPGTLKFHEPEGGGWEEVERHIAEPGARQRFQQARRALKPIRTAPRLHDIPLAINPLIAVHKPLIGPAHNGMLVRDRARTDQAAEKARRDLEQSLMKALPANLRPVQPMRQPSNPH